MASEQEVQINLNVLTARVSSEPTVSSGLDRLFDNMCGILRGFQEAVATAELSEAARWEIVNQIDTLATAVMSNRQQIVDDVLRNTGVAGPAAAEVAVPQEESGQNPTEDEPDPEDEHPKRKSRRHR